MTLKNTLKSYLISDPKYYGNEIETFSITLTKALIQYSPDYACFRDKREYSSKPEFAKLFVEISRRYGISSFLNSDFNLAFELGYDGVHLPSYMLDKIDIVKKFGLKIFVSCHDETEIEFCEKIGVDAITLSPVFSSPDKGKPLGVEKFGKMIENINTKVFALGGITDSLHIEKIKKSKAYGFASIRYFVD